jgi:hypothetical protein
LLILKLEKSSTYDDRINLVRNIESLIRFPQPIIQLFLVKLDVHFLIAKLILQEVNSSTSNTSALSQYQDELQIACYDFLGELIKQNKLCFAMVETQFGETNLKRLVERALSETINSNLFLRSIMISLIYFSETLDGHSFIQQSYLCLFLVQNCS